MGHGLTADPGAALRVVAVDWSGRRHGERRAIWCAEVRGGELARLENGRSRAEVGDHLLELAARHPAVVVGLDFSFSLPAWFLRARGLDTVDDLWRAAALEGDGWIERCEPPFWGRAGTRRPALPAHLRRTEEAIGSVGGIRPKSTFQLSGAGSVGTGSLRGFPLLARLRAAGWSIWPFDAAVPPVALEVWPRSLTGPVVKSRADTRARHLALNEVAIRRELRDRAIASEDAFDAALTALGMAPHAAAIAALPAATDDDTRLEGAIWLPPGPPGVHAIAVSRRATEVSTSPGSSCNTSAVSTK